MIASLFLLVLGLPLAMRGRRRSITIVAGEAYLLGAGVASLLLLAMSMAGIAWSATALIVGAVVVAALSLVGVRKTFYVPPLRWWNVGDLFTLALVAGYTRLALASAPVEVDFIFMWGIKAKKFFFARGIDWAYLKDPINWGCHPDYPQLVPFVFDVHALLGGGWDDRSLGLVNVAFGAAALLVIRGWLAEEISAPWSVVASAMLMPLVFSPYMGMAEGAIIAYSIAALLHLRSGQTLRAAVFLGFAAFTKNEGLALIVAVAAGLVATRRWRELPRLAPALAIPLPWLFLRWLHQLSTDLMEGSVLTRLVAHLADPWPIFEAMKRHPAGSLLFWLGIATACLLSFRNVIGKERFLTVVIATQLLFFVAAYFISPRGIEWHVQWSWERIVRQLMPAVALLAVYTSWHSCSPERASGSGSRSGSTSAST